MEEYGKNLSFMRETESPSTASRGSSPRKARYTGASLAGLKENRRSGKLNKKIERVKAKGIQNIILDVGIGFGKTKEDNFELLNRIEEFYSLNLPIMVGISRKSFLGVADNNDLKDSITLALSYPLIQKNIDYLRVHNVKLHRQLLNSVI